MLFPGDQQDVLDLGVHAFRLSRYAGAWVGLKIVTAVADGIGTVDLDPGRHHPRDPDDVVIDGRPWRHQPLATIGPHAVPDQEVLVADRRLRAARAYARHNGLDRVIGRRARRAARRGLRGQDLLRRDPGPRRPRASAPANWPAPASGS